jgi:hypothetical protein
MQEKGNVSGSPGASGYAPDHANDTSTNRSTTGSGDKDKDDMMKK